MAGRWSRALGLAEWDGTEETIGCVPWLIPSTLC